ncbi:MAG: autotransporter-associated beta strand repeat-containing protein, partial [Verrucomicrobiota bacterium]|nr:autotransporter-associated beta strand repeat-containing protein [Verrucomicrobiota bacterium]
NRAAITNKAGLVAGALGGTTIFGTGTHGGSSHITCEGAMISGVSGGLVAFSNSASAGNATLIAEGGSNGGEGGLITFQNKAAGATSRVELLGNGILDISGVTVPIMIGSLEGDGLVQLGSRKLSIGGTDQSTAFAGVIQGTGSVTKIGMGTLSLNGVNTYTGATTVNAGTLGGRGTITGPVNVDDGGFLAPAEGTSKQATLTIQSSLTFYSGATYTYTFKAKRNKTLADEVLANGVTIRNGATLALSGQVQGVLEAGLSLSVISNTAATPISGTFSNLPEGAIVNVGGANLQASYHGGDGNDLTLTVVP